MSFHHHLVQGKQAVAGGHPGRQQQSWALVWPCQSLTLSILQFQSQQQEGEGPQQTPLEVVTQEGSKERKPGVHRGLHCAEGYTCQANSGNLLGCSPAVLCSEKCQVEGL